MYILVKPNTYRVFFAKLAEVFVKRECEPRKKYFPDVFVRGVWKVPGENRIYVSKTLFGEQISHEHFWVKWNGIKKGKSKISANCNAHILALEYLGYTLPNTIQRKGNSEEVCKKLFEIFEEQNRDDIAAQEKETNSQELIIDSDLTEKNKAAKALSIIGKPIADKALVQTYDTDTILSVVKDYLQDIVRRNDKVEFYASSKKLEEIFSIAEKALHETQTIKNDVGKTFDKVHHYKAIFDLTKTINDRASALKFFTNYKMLSDEELINLLIIPVPEMTRWIFKFLPDIVSDQNNIKIIVAGLTQRGLKQLDEPFLIYLSSALLEIDFEFGLSMAMDIYMLFEKSGNLVDVVLPAVILNRTKVFFSHYGASLKEHTIKSIIDVITRFQDIIPVASYLKELLYAIKIKAMVEDNDFLQDHANFLDNSMKKATIGSIQNLLQQSKDENFDIISQSLWVYPNTYGNRTFMYLKKHMPNIEDLLSIESQPWKSLIPKK